MSATEGPAAPPYAEDNLEIEASFMAVADALLGFRDGTSAPLPDLAALSASLPRGGSLGRDLGFAFGPGSCLGAAKGPSSTGGEEEEEEEEEEEDMLADGIVLLPPRPDPSASSPPRPPLGDLAASRNAGAGPALETKVPAAFQSPKVEGRWGGNGAGDRTGNGEGAGREASSFSFASVLPAVTAGLDLGEGGSGSGSSSSGSHDLGPFNGFKDLEGEDGEEEEEGDEQDAEEEEEEADASNELLPSGPPGSSLETSVDRSDSDLVLGSGLDTGSQRQGGTRSPLSTTSDQREEVAEAVDSPPPAPRAGGVVDGVARQLQRAGTQVAGQDPLQAAGCYEGSGLDDSLGLGDAAASEKAEEEVREEAWRERDDAMSSSSSWSLPSSRDDDDDDDDDGDSYGETFATNDVSPVSTVVAERKLAQLRIESGMGSADGRSSLDRIIDIGNEERRAEGAEPSTSLVLPGRNGRGAATEVSVLDRYNVCTVGGQYLVSLASPLHGEPPLAAASAPPRVSGVTPFGNCASDSDDEDTNVEEDEDAYEISDDDDGEDALPADHHASRKSFPNTPIDKLPVPMEDEEDDEDETMEELDDEGPDESAVDDTSDEGGGEDETTQRLSSDARGVPFSPSAEQPVTPSATAIAVDGLEQESSSFPPTSAVAMAAWIEKHMPKEKDRLLAILSPASAREGSTNIPDSKGRVAAIPKLEKEDGLLPFLTEREYERAPAFVAKLVTKREANSAIAALNEWAKAAQARAGDCQLELPEEEAYELLSELNNRRKAKSVLMSLCHWKRLVLRISAIGDEPQTLFSLQTKSA